MESAPPEPTLRGTDPVPEFVTGFTITSDGTRVAERRPTQDTHFTAWMDAVETQPSLNSFVVEPAASRRRTILPQHPSFNIPEPTDMPRASSNNGYSREDWNHMLSGCFVRILSSRKLVYVLEFGTNDNGDGFVLYGEDKTQGSRTYGGRITLNFTNDTAETLFDFNRPRGRIVHVSHQLSYMVRPLIRRTRRKGLFCEDYEAVNLLTGTRSTLNRVGEREYVANVLFGTAPNPEARANGQLTIVAADVMPQGRVRNSRATPNVNNIVGQLLHQLSRSEVTLDATSEGWDEDTVVKLGLALGIRLPGSRLMWHDATIGSVTANNITLYENADLLIGLVRENYPEYTVLEVDDAIDNF